jgi:hypothetical protein
MRLCSALLRIVGGRGRLNCRRQTLEPDNCSYGLAVFHFIEAAYNC